MSLLRHLLTSFLLLFGPAVFAAENDVDEMTSRFTRVESVALSGERYVLLGVGDGTAVFVNWQNSSNIHWTGWQEIPGTQRFKEVRGVASTEHTVAVFAIDRDGQVWLNRQALPSRNWSEWQMVSGVTGFWQISPVAAADGRLVCFGIGSGTVWVNSQIPGQSRWLGWEHLTGIPRASFVRANVARDGKVHVYAGGRQFERWMTRESSEGGWEQWQTDTRILAARGDDSIPAPALFYDVPTGGMKIYRWARSGQRFRLVTTPLPGPYPVASVGDHMVAADVNGDRRTDIVTASQNTDGTICLHVFLSGHVYQGDRGWFQSGSFDMSNVGGRMVAGDFNGDGNEDVAMLYDTANALRVFRFLSTGRSFSAEATQYPAYVLSNVLNHVAAADVNADGRTDVVSAHQYPDGSMRLHVFTNGNLYLGSNGWFQASAFDLTKVAGRMKGGDFNGDGRGDVLMFRETTNGTVVHRFLSTGTNFTSDVMILAPDQTVPASGHRIAAADMDGDGQMDIVAANQNSDGTFSFHVFRNGQNDGHRPWYRSGPFDLGNVIGRLTLGAWQLPADAPATIQASK